MSPEERAWEVVHSSLYLKMKTALMTKTGEMNVCPVVSYAPKICRKKFRLISVIQYYYTISSYIHTYIYTHSLTHMY